MTEVWRPIPAWEDLYEVSSLGRVRSKDRRIYCKNPFGVVAERNYKAKMLKPGVLKNGYYMVSFTAPNRRREFLYVQALVLKAFVGPCPPGLEICHNDGVKTNNALTNLRYDTRKANAKDTTVHGQRRPAKGEAAGSAKLRTADVIWVLCNEGAMSRRCMSRILGVSHRTVCDILNGERWVHVTGIRKSLS